MEGGRDKWGYLWWNRPPRSVPELLSQVGLHGLVLLLSVVKLDLPCPVFVAGVVVPCSVRLVYGFRYLRSHPEVRAAYSAERAAEIRDFDERLGGGRP